MTLLALAMTTAACSHHDGNSTRNDAAGVRVLLNNPSVRRIIERIAPRCSEQRQAGSTRVLAAAVTSATTKLQGQGLQVTYLDVAKSLDHLTAETFQVSKPRRVSCRYAAESIIELKPLEGTVVSTRGRIGRLRLDVSTAADIRSALGTPPFAGTGSPSRGFGRPYRALGYECSRRRSATFALDPGGARPAHRWCRTVYFLAASTGRLAGFWTDSPAIQTEAGTRPGIDQVLADQLEGAHPHVEALTGISQRTRATSLFIENVGCTPGPNLNSSPCLGGRVRALILEGQHPVGLLEDAIPNA
jgi:hypothetical protein